MVIEEIKSYIDSLTTYEYECLIDILQSIHPDIHYDRVTRVDTTADVSVKCCPHCGSTHFVKNGFNQKIKQKYRC